MQKSTTKVEKKQKKGASSELNLPKGYLSWSQFSLWQRSPDQYRREYYYGVKRAPSPEMRYGDAIARLLESGAHGPVIDKIPRYSVSEYEIKTEIGGVPILAFLDTFDPLGLKFREFKSGHSNYKGEAPWNGVKVRKHGQLVFYAAAIAAKHGKVDPVCYLDWIETEKLPITEDFGGIELTGTDTRSLRLTGRIESFKRHIAKWEVVRMRGEICVAAVEISKDYSKFQKEFNF